MSKQTTVRFDEEFLEEMNTAHQLTKPQKVLEFLIAIYNHLSHSPTLIRSMQKQLENGCTVEEMIQRIETAFPEKALLPDGDPDDLQGVFQPPITNEDIGALQDEISQLRQENERLQAIFEGKRLFEIPPYKHDNYLHGDQKVYSTFSDFDQAIIGADSPEKLDQIEQMIAAATNVTKNQTEGLLKRVRGRKALMKHKKSV